MMISSPVFRGIFFIWDAVKNWGIEIFYDVEITYSVSRIWENYAMSEVINIIDQIPTAIDISIHLDGCFLVSGSKVDAPI